MCRCICEHKNKYITSEHYNYTTSKNRLSGRFGSMTDSHIHMRINKDLKLELQIIALKKNTTITSIINELIEDYVNENK